MDFSAEKFVSSSLKVQVFKGVPEKWPAFRDAIEAIAASMDLKDVLTSARPSEKEMFEDESDDSEGELCTTPEGKKSEDELDESEETVKSEETKKPKETKKSEAEVRPPPVKVAGPRRKSSSRPTPGELWDKKARKVYLFLLMYTDGIAKAVVSQFRETNDGHAAYHALRDRFEHRGSLGKTILHQRLRNFKISPNEDPADAFLRLERLWYDLIELDDAPAENSIVGIVLAGLPQKEYGQIIILLDMVPSLSYLELKEKITIFYKRKTSAKDLSGDGGSTQALLTQEKKSTKDWKSSAECFRCHKIGHVKRDCPLLKNDKKSDSGAKKEWRGSGAKSGFQEKKTKVRWDSKTEKSSGPKENIAMTIWDQESSEFDWDAVGRNESSWAYGYPLYR